MRKPLIAIIVVRSDGDDKTIVDLVSVLDNYCNIQSQVKGQIFQMTLVPAIVARLKRFITCLT